MWDWQIAEIKSITRINTLDRWNDRSDKLKVMNSRRSIYQSVIIWFILSIDYHVRCQAAFALPCRNLRVSQPGRGRYHTNYAFLNREFVTRKRRNLEKMRYTSKKISKDKLSAELSIDIELVCLSGFSISEMAHVDRTSLVRSSVRVL